MITVDTEITKIQSLRGLHLAIRMLNIKFIIVELPEFSKTDININLKDTNSTSI